MLTSLFNAARFLLPLIAALAVLAVLAVPVAERMMGRWLAGDLDQRAELVRDALGAQIVTSLRSPPDSDDPVRKVTNEFVVAFDNAAREDLMRGLALCSADGVLLAATERAQFGDRCGHWRVMADSSGIRLDGDRGPIHVRVLSVRDADGARPMAFLVTQQSYAFSDGRLSTARLGMIGLFALTAAIAAMMTLAIARITWRGWLARAHALLRARPSDNSPAMPKVRFLQPLAKDLQSLIETLEGERNERPFGDGQWSPKGLRDLLSQQFPGDEVIVVSNREPYIHAHRDGGIVVQRPASGLVSAVEPVMRACSGTWIAHGSGDADREVVDERDCVTVPPGLKEPAPVYALRRIWLTPEEEKGFYYGFANEGLWPLCHVAHVRPQFRDEDWEHYKAVNQRFAEAVAAQAKTDDPVVLIQDYHFALAPAMVRELLPDATIITFWHIPWPNFESFSICPWKEELLQGLLGSDILGFHTPYHCRNFLETVDRVLEVRIEHESDTISMGGNLTHVHDYPISIAWPQPLPVEAFAGLRERVRAHYGLPLDHRLAIGVDRLDYTKGIVERVRAVDRLLERYPQWVGHFTLVQIAAPSRTALPEYTRFEADVHAVVDAVNQRHGRGDYHPIRLLVKHHDSDTILEHYRAADIALVTSLHDGMNLVSKEFVGAHDDERGVLIVSQFAGAARELVDALVVNPYHSDEVAQAMHYALTMPEAEQQLRMRSMRQLVKAFNVYRWAGRMLLDAGRLRRRVRLEQRIRQGRAKAKAQRVATPPCALDDPTAGKWLREAVSAGALLAFDFDGTLAPIVADPDAAVPDHRVLGLLAALAARHPVAIVSGRGRDDLRRRVPVDGVTLIGSHGNEWAEGDLDAAERDLLREQVDQVGRWARQLDSRLALEAPGAMLETKRLSLTVHYRGAADPMAMRARVAAICKSLDPEPTLIDGKFVWNLVPARAATKFDATERLRRNLGAPTVVFVGDDATDEIVFERAPPEWLTVKVFDGEAGLAAGSRTAARLSVRGVEGVVELIGRLLHL